MANFLTPFANAASRRYPTADEKTNGFPCGPADQTLFNGLFYRIESEIGQVISYAGLTPSDADLSQLRKAIVSLIEAATGGGDTDSYLLLSQAAARLPIFPEVRSADGRINYTSPAPGTVRLPGGVDILHRGISLITTAQTDFATLASRTYHLRWNPADGFQLKLSTDPAYNPDGYAEDHPSFDSTYDDMLLARVITNSGNVATITSLANKNRLVDQIVDPNNAALMDLANTGDAFRETTLNWNWARVPLLTPLVTALNVGGATPGSQGFLASESHDHDQGVVVQSLSRYGAALRMYRDFGRTFSLTAQVQA